MQLLLGLILSVPVGVISNAIYDFLRPRVNARLQCCKRMQRIRRTTEQRDAALDLLRTVGLAEAARRTGIPVGTIASWGHRLGVEAATAGELAPAVEAKRLSLVERRTALGAQFLATAEQLLADVADEDVTIDRKRLVEAARIAAETSNLLLGEATARVDAMGGSPKEQAVALVAQLRQRQAS